MTTESLNVRIGPRSCPDIYHSPELIAGHRLSIEREGQVDVITIAGSDGGARLAIHITEEGPVLRFEQCDLTVQAAGTLRVAADRVAIHGEAGLDLSTNGDLTMSAEGRTMNVARQQTLKAELGNVDVQANDDVRLEGLRIKMNC